MKWKRYGALALLIILALPLARGNDVPYSFGPDPAQNHTCNGIANAGGGDLYNGDIPANINMEGIRDSDFTGKTLTSIGLYLCAYDASGTADFIDTNLVRIGVFDASGNPISIFASVAFSALAHGDGTVSVNNNIAEVVVGGNHVLLAGEIVGASFSSTNHSHFLLDMYQYVLPSCHSDGFGCIPNGDLVATGPGGYVWSPQGSAALAGDFLFSGGAPAQASTCQSVVNLAPFLVVLFPIMIGASIIQKKRNSETGSSDGKLIVGFVIFITICLAFAGAIAANAQGAC